MIHNDEVDLSVSNSTSLLSPFSSDISASLLGSAQALSTSFSEQDSSIIYMATEERESLMEGEAQCTGTRGKEGKAVDNLSMLTSY